MHSRMSANGAVEDMDGMSRANGEKEERKVPADSITRAHGGGAV